MECRLRCRWCLRRLRGRAIRQPHLSLCRLRCLRLPLCHNLQGSFKFRLCRRGSFHSLLDERSCGRALLNHCSLLVLGCLDRGALADSAFRLVSPVRTSKKSQIVEAKLRIFNENVAAAARVVVFIEVHVLRILLPLFDLLNLKICHFQFRSLLVQDREVLQLRIVFFFVISCVISAVRVISKIATYPGKCCDTRPSRPGVYWTIRFAQRICCRLITVMLHPDQPLWSSYRVIPR
jgi:hypothetical protein